MKKNACIPNERVIINLEEEIIREKTRAYKVAIQQLFPFPLMTKPFISEYKYKLQRQFKILFNTAKQIYFDPKAKQELIKKNFPLYYHHTPLYSALLLQIPRIFKPNFIKRVVNQLERLNLRYFRRRITFSLILFEKLAALQNQIFHSDDELLRRIFANKNFLMEFIYLHIEIEKKKYQIIKKGGDWTHLAPQDYLQSFSLSSISFYQYVSSIWKTLAEVLPIFLETKITNLYYLKTLENDKLEIVKTGSYRYKIVKEFPRSPQIMTEIFHDPEILMKNYPSKDITIEKIAPNRLRYTISDKIPLMRIVLKYDLCYSITQHGKGYFEEWWVENSNYIKKMTGFAIFEETLENNCRYADILVDLVLDDKLKPFEDVIIPALETLVRKNIEQLMENIYQSFISQDRLMLHSPGDECKELS